MADINIDILLIKLAVIKMYKPVVSFVACESFSPFALMEARKTPIRVSV